MSFHREQAQQEMQSIGMPVEAAEHATRRQFAMTRAGKNHEIVGFRIESDIASPMGAFRSLKSVLTIHSSKTNKGF
jgi:hypothetical protein